MGHTALDTPGCASLQYQDPRNQNEAPHPQIVDEHESARLSDLIFFRTG